MDPTLVATLATAFATILAAFVGYLVTYWNNIRIAQRSEQLSRVNRQLTELYGPMYSLVSASNQAFKALRMKHRVGIHYFTGDPPPTEDDLKAWRTWMTAIFMPRNLQLQELITSKSELLIETDMPFCLRDLCAHVAAYQVVLKQWENNDFSEHRSVIHFPGRDLLEYSHNSFKSLKEKQKKLIGELEKSK